MAIVMLSDCLENLAPNFQPMRSKTKSKTNRNFLRDFSRTFSKLHVIAWNSHWFIALFAGVSIGGCVAWFFDSHLETALCTYE